MRLAGPVIAILATAATVAVVARIAGSPPGTQPWGAELSDNFVFARALPLALGLGVLLGMIGGRMYAARDATRRFSPAVIAGHWLIALGVLIALPTGVWQYMGGILDVPGPLPVHIYYRLHYVGAGIILVAVAAFLTYWWMTGDRSLLVPRGAWRRHLRGLAQELPPAVGSRLASLLRLDRAAPAGQPGSFTFYEKVVSFPSWTFAIALITVTGLVKVVRYVIPIPGPILFFDSTLHVTAMVLLIIKTLDHLRYTLARWPLVVAMTTGRPSGPPSRRVTSSAEGSAAQTVGDG